ncbi:MAG: AAA family ATPase [Dehalococcoidia bacterium]|nr:AAA family ATPase [Dehalococcoidia bacterium]
MFETFFGFARTPFHKTLPPADLFVSVQQQELLARLHYLAATRGLGVVSGEVGSGKSTTVRAWVPTLDPARHRVMYLVAPASPRTLYRAICSHLGLEPAWLAPDLARQAADALSALVAKGTTPVLLVDEAQELSPAVLTALRFLTQAEMDSVSPLALILVGHPALRQRLKLNTYEAFAQRVGLRFHLTGLTAAETADYIRHHLRVAGRDQPLFTDAAVELLFHHSRGIPRLLNTLATQALLGAFQARQNLVDEHVVQKAVQESHAS